MKPSRSSFVLRLNHQDNILVIGRSLAQGQTIEIEGHPFILPLFLGLGHKLAARLIKQGEKIIKQGVAIGSATEDILPGQHVHLHNMKSDYLPTYTLEKGQQFCHAPP